MPAGTPALGRTGLLARLRPGAGAWPSRWPPWAPPPAWPSSRSVNSGRPGPRSWRWPPSSTSSLDLETVRAGGDLADAEEVAVVAALDELAPVEGRP